MCLIPCTPFCRGQLRPAGPPFSSWFRAAAPIMACSGSPSIKLPAAVSSMKGGLASAAAVSTRSACRTCLGLFSSSPCSVLGLYGHIKALQRGTHGMRPSTLRAGAALACACTERQGRAIVEVQRCGNALQMAQGNLIPLCILGRLCCSGSRSYTLDHGSARDTRHCCVFGRALKQPAQQLLLPAAEASPQIAMTAGQKKCLHGSCIQILAKAAYSGKVVQSVQRTVRPAQGWLATVRQSTSLLWKSSSYPAGSMAAM